MVVDKSVKQPFSRPVGELDSSYNSLFSWYHQKPSKWIAWILRPSKCRVLVHQEQNMEVNMEGNGIYLHLAMRTWEMDDHFTY